MNRQERESIERSITSHVLASLAKDRPDTSASEKRAFVLLLKTWILPLLPLLAIIIGSIYWQFIFDFKASVNDLIAKNPTVVAVSEAINGSNGQPGLRERLGKIDREYEEISTDLHMLMNLQLKRLGDLPSLEV